jgi:ethanolamine-phosphate cytidylyltransferase
MEGRKTRGYLDGCFDLMHSGHFNAIRQAKTLCDILVVGISSDAEIALNKASPVLKERERYELLKHIKWIDEIIYDVPYSPSLAFINEHNIDFVIHGDDMPLNQEGKNPYEDIIRANKLKIIRRTEGVSTTDIVGRMLLLSKDHLNPSDGSTKSSMLLSSRRLSEFSSRRAPTLNDKVVYFDGGFDIFNIGHADALKKARDFGTYLIVGIFDDETVNRMKGSNFPIQNLAERVLNLSACKWVDEVIIGAPLEISEDMIKSMNISLVVAGTHTGAEPMMDSKVSQKNHVPTSLGIYRFIDSEWGYLNVQEIANRIIENRATYIKRNAKKALAEKEFYMARDTAAISEV